MGLGLRVEGLGFRLEGLGARAYVHESGLMRYILKGFWASRTQRFWGGVHKL